ncbi:MAG: hypothetical protein ACUVSX_09085 [Aggregatilineales bacterium]
MSNIEAICQAYARMRDGGIAVKAALNLLRDSIDALDETDKLAVARQLRDYEAQRSDGAGAPTAAAAAHQSDAAASRPRPLAARQANAALLGLEWVNCPRCGRSNQRHEVLCYACGHLLQATRSASETQALAETNDLSHSNDFFGQDTVLVLRARATGRVYEVQPQRSDHELVIGRGAAGSAVLA